MLGKKTVLIIDDEEDLRDTVEYKFRHAGFNVVTAVDGLDGLEKLEKIEPDLIILDMNMPRMNGIEFYQKLKDSEKQTKYPILILTARANMEQLFRELDIDGFMAKPFVLEDLLKEAEGIIRKYSGSTLKEKGTDKIRARRVCIVENDINVFNKMALTLLESGYIVNSAHTGASAIKRITMDMPDIALISLSLNDISGEIVIGKLNRIANGKDIKFILYTDKIADIDKINMRKIIAEKEGITRFVESNDPKDLLAVIDALF